MRRIAAVACLFAAAALLPIQAEARPRGGRSSAATTKTNSTLVVMPGAAGLSGAKAGQATKPERVPFPPSTMAREAPPQLRLTASEGAQKPWCRSDVVVGGFCMMN